MKKQNLVKHTLIENLSKVTALTTSCNEKSRTAIATELCNRLSLFDHLGKPQVASCLKSLRELESEGLCELPEAKIKKTLVGPPRLLHSVAAPSCLPDSVEKLDGLKLHLVIDKEDSKIWNELMISEHPLNSARLVGRQIRYLIHSPYGCLGAIGFGACALHLKDRDQWIGWNDDQRKQHLDRLTCLNRFLIRPSVRCENLASYVLSKIEQIFADDFERLYGYKPWLIETYVEQNTHTGASLKAANWSMIGKTNGRGRQDINHKKEKTIKDIYVKVIAPGFRSFMGLSEPKNSTPLAIGDGLDEETWATNEFGDAKLGDRRLTRRLVSIARIKGTTPSASFLETVKGKVAEVDGYYRFMDQPCDGQGQIDMDSVLATHRQRTLLRMQGQEKVLLIHDTTDLNFNTLKKCAGLGVIGKNQQKGSESKGLRLHSSYVVEAQEGIPLGVLNWNCYAPALKPEHENKDKRYIPIEKKETYRWVSALRTCGTKAIEIPSTHVIHVMDREADFYEIFYEWANTTKLVKNDLVIRAQHNRIGEDGKKIFDVISRLGPMGLVEVKVPRKSARPKTRHKEEQKSQVQRQAMLTLKWQSIKIKSPPLGICKGMEAVTTNLLHAREENPPSGSKPIEWYLLTTIPLESEEDAIKVLGYYAKRWRIEDWHRILKTCCRVEKPAHEDAECLKRVTAINMVIAWRIHNMTLLGREVPELPAEVIFSDIEIKVLAKFAKQNKYLSPTCLGNAVILLGKLGGYLNRKGDSPPGAEVLCKGIIRLTSMCIGFSLAETDSLSSKRCD